MTGRALAATLLSAALLGTGCASPMEKHCARLQECGRIDAEEEARCARDGQADLEAQRKKGNACATLASLHEELLLCEAELTCDLLGSVQLLNHCRTERRAYVESVLANASCL